MTHDHPTTGTEWKGGKKRKYGSSARKYRDKKAVITLVERGGRVRSTVADKEDAATVTKILTAHVEPGATLMTDGAHAYTTVGRSFAHHWTVDHSKGEYVRGPAHTGTVDAFYGLLKRGHYGVFHVISPKYLSRYVSEFDYRYSRRAVTDGARTLTALRTMDGKRLRLVDLKANG